MNNTIRKDMNRMKTWILTAIFSLCGTCAILISCNSKKQPTKVDCTLVSGTLEGPLKPDNVPANVMEALEKAERLHTYEIMSDTVHSICVEAIAEADTTSTEGYGIVVVKGSISTTFPNFRNSRTPSALYDNQSKTLWLSCNIMSGTSVHVDQLYMIKFGDNDIAYIAHTIDPYTIQQLLCKRLGYTITGNMVTLYDDGWEITNATNTMTDMGGFDSEQPVWIGEQIQYDLSTDFPYLLITPGVKFTTGLVLTYDNMPTLIAPFTIIDDGKISIGDFYEYKGNPTESFK